MHERVLLSAREAGDWIGLGAPNAMRSGSHLGSPGAAEMIARGLCDILASDYFYPAMLGAVARLRADEVGDLPALWRLVSANPAAAMGLTDRGLIAPGLRADLILLDWPEGAPPRRPTHLERRQGRIFLAARQGGVSCGNGLFGAVRKRYLFDGIRTSRDTGHPPRRSSQTGLKTACGHP